MYTAYAKANTKNSVDWNHGLIRGHVLFYEQQIVRALPEPSAPLLHKRLSLADRLIDNLLVGQLDRVC